MTHLSASRRLTGFIAFALALLMLAPSAFSQMAQLKWTKIANFPEPAEEILGAAANGKMYVFAGLIPLWHPKGLVYEYDPATEKWTKKKPMALPSHHVAFTEYKGKIYAFGGFVYPQSGPAAWVPINNAFEYDPEADTWKALAPMPTKRGAELAAAVGDKIYVIGGVTTRAGATDPAIGPASPQTVLGTVEEYDPANNTWRERSPMPTPRNHFVVAAVNGKIYAIGGRLASPFVSLGSDTDVVEEYDPATDMWGVPRARMTTPRASMVAGVYNGRIYISGGEIQSAQVSSTFRTVEAFDPAANQWSVLPPMPLGRQPVAGDVIGDTFYVVSGDNGDRPLVGLRTASEPFPFDALRLDHAN